MFSKFLRVSIATLAVAFSPVAAEATIYEAVWQVQLTRQIVDDVVVGITRPSAFEYRVRFSNDVWYVDDEFQTETWTFFDQTPIVHTRPIMDYLPARPEGGTRLAYNNLYGYTVDEAWGFTENVTATEHELIDTGDLYWQHSTFLRNIRNSEAQSGVGESDYAMAGEDLLAYLGQVMTDPDAFSLVYSEHLYIRAGEFGGILHSMHWQGNMRLTSLRALDATDVPEPPLMALIGTGLVGIALVGRRQRQRLIKAY